MRALLALNWRRRSLVALALAIVSSLTLIVSGALADAGNPLLGTIKATAVDNHDGTVTVYVRGQWNWLSHNSDCNFDRAAEGVGIIWNDPTETGFTVTQGHRSPSRSASRRRTSAACGRPTRTRSTRWCTRSTAATRSRATPSRAPITRPRRPSPTRAPPASRPTQLNAWRGGCGRQPLTATASKGSNPERTGQTCGNGGILCSTHPWGSWGYEKNGGLGYAHTYLKTLLERPERPSEPDLRRTSTTCTAAATRTRPASRSRTTSTEITVDGNGDNSIDTNDFDSTDGTYCIYLVTTATTTDIHNASDTIVTTVPAGTTVHDYVTVSAPGHPAATGQVTLDWFTNNTCSGAPPDDVGADGAGRERAARRDRASRVGPLARGSLRLQGPLPRQQPVPAFGRCM